MPNLSITTTLYDHIFVGDNYLETLSFKNVSTAGIIYLRNVKVSKTTVSSTSFEYALGVNAAIGLTKQNDGEMILGPWQAISDTAGGVTLAILPGYNSQKPG